MSTFLGNFELRLFSLFIFVSESEINQMIKICTALIMIWVFKYLFQDSLRCGPVLTFGDSETFGLSVKLNSKGCSGDLDLIGDSDIETLLYTPEDFSTFPRLLLFSWFSLYSNKKIMLVLHMLLHWSEYIFEAIFTMNVLVWIFRFLFKILGMDLPLVVCVNSKSCKASAILWHLFLRQFSVVNYY